MDMRADEDEGQQEEEEEEEDEEEEDEGALEDEEEEDIIADADKDEDEEEEDKVACEVCEETGTVLRVWLRCATPEDLDSPPRKLIQFCKNPTHSVVCVECIRQNMLINKAVPCCPECSCRADVEQTLNFIPKTAEYFEVSTRILQLFSIHDSIFHPTCPKCRNRGSAFGDGVIQFPKAMKRTRCWTPTGAHAQDLTKHVPLCEDCGGAINRCMCNARSKPFAINHFHRDISRLEVLGGSGSLIHSTLGLFLTRNIHLTEQHVAKMLCWLLDNCGSAVPAMCPGCLVLMWRSDACNELKCTSCGYAICFHCGYAARGPHLVDHYVGGRCVQFERLVKMYDGTRYPCTQECQSHFHGDCQVVEHQRWKNWYASERLRKWGKGFLLALPPKLATFGMNWLVTVCFPTDPPLRLPLSFEPVPLLAVVPEMDAVKRKQARTMSHGWIQAVEDTLT